MSVTAPTPPTKPTPPSLTPTGSHSATDTSVPTAPANVMQNSSNSVSPEVAGAAKKVGEIGKALQGNQDQTKDGAKVTSDTTDKASVSKTIPVTATDSQNTTATQTTTTDVKSPAINSKPTSLSYAPFIGIVVVVAVVLVGLRFFKNKTKEPRTMLDYSQRTDTVMSKEGVDIAVSPQAPSPKVKKNFEVRI